MSAVEDPPVFRWQTTGLWRLTSPYTSAFGGAGPGHAVGFEDV